MKKNKPSPEQKAKRPRKNKYLLLAFSFLIVIFITLGGVPVNAQYGDAGVFDGINPAGNNIPEQPAAENSNEEEFGTKEAKEMAQAVNDLWKDLVISENGSLTTFGILANNLRGLAILLIGWELGQSFINSRRHDNFDEYLREYFGGKFIPTALIIISLQNNGYIAGHAIYSGKAFFDGIEKGAYESIIFKAGTTSIINAGKESRAVLEPIGLQLENCYSIPSKINGKKNPALAKCLQAASSEIDSAIGSGKITNQRTVDRLKKSQSVLNEAATSDDPDSGLIKAGQSLKKDNTWSWNPLEGIQDALYQIIRLIGFVYSTAIDFAWLLMSIAAPVPLIFSMMNPEPLKKFLPQFMNLFIAKLCFSLATGLFVFVQNKVGGEFAGGFGVIAFGLGVPAISIVLTMMMSGSVGSVFERSVMGGVAKGMGAAGKLGGMAAGGAMKGASAAAGAMKGAGGGAVGSGLATAGASAGGATQTIDVPSRRV